jgi:hypothetical protein
VKILRILVLAAIATVAVAAFAAPAQARLVQFTSPSGNIDCMGDTVGQPGGPWVQCLVERANWRGPARPARCDLDWVGTQLQLQRRKVDVGSCRGDVGPMCIPPGAGGTACKRLAYGRAINIGTIRCTSATNGMTCRQRSAPRVGFRVARQNFVVFRS